MRKNQYILFLIICLFIFPKITHAKCDYQRASELNKIASNVQTSYTYRLEGDSLVYDVELSNITDDIYVLDSDGVVFNSSSYIRNYNYPRTITYTIYSNDPNCHGERIVSKSVVLPYFNNYSLLDECKNKPNHKYCLPWTNTFGLSKEDVLNVLVNYNEEVQNKSDKSQNYKFEFINYVLIAVFVVICVCIILIIIRRKKYA